MVRDSAKKVPERFILSLMQYVHYSDILH